MIWIPRPRPVGWSEGVRQLAVVHDVDTDGVGFGPEGQLDGVVGGGRCVGVLDAVARRLAHGEHQVVFGVLGQGERGQPAAHLSPQGRQLAGMRMPAAVREFGRFTLCCGGCRLAHVVSSRVRYPRSCADCATGVQGDVLVLTTVTRGCPIPYRCASRPRSRQADVVRGLRTRTGQPADGSGSACSSPTGGCATHPLRRCTATGGSRRSREDMDADPHRGRRTASALGSRAGQTGKRHPPETGSTGCVAVGLPDGAASNKRAPGSGATPLRGRYRHRRVTVQHRAAQDLAGRGHPVDYTTPGYRPGPRRGGHGPDRQRGAEAPRAPRRSRSPRASLRRWREAWFPGEEQCRIPGLKDLEPVVHPSLHLRPPASRVFAVCRLAPTDGLICLPRMVVLFLSLARCGPCVHAQ